jgi:hypothetical protein
MTLSVDVVTMGMQPLQLAYHAAMPVALNPELLHFLRINFFLDPPEQLLTLSSLSSQFWIVS